MIQIDRSSPVPVHTQLADQLRYEIAAGRYRVGEMVPSTRQLGRRLDISFHTVRKVYQELERGGFLESRPGAGFVVAEGEPVRQEDRMEHGASIVHDALKRMLGLGLTQADVEYLFEEQWALLDSASAGAKIVVAAPFLEMAERCAEQVGSGSRVDVEPSTLRGLSAHRDADVVIAPFRELKAVMQAVPGADHIGVSTALPSDLLDAAARLHADASVAIIVRDDDAVQPLMQELRSATAFGGPMVAMSINERPEELIRKLRDAEFAIATPGCMRRLRGRLPEGRRLYLADLRLSEGSIARVRSLLPHQ